MKKSFFLILLSFAVISSFGQFGFERVNTIEVSKEGTLKQPWVGGLDFCQFSNIDLNFDGTLDLFVFDRNSNKVLTFIQTGAPGTSDFVYAPEYESEFPDELKSWALLVDYNCDGKMDIYTSYIGGISIYRNVGDAETGNAFVLEETILTTTNADGGVAYLFVGPADIPAIVDVDGDDDIDILSFRSDGRTVGYYRNMSQELYSTCDSLEYETKNRCWGRFREGVSTNDVVLWDTLVFPCEGYPEDEMPPFTDEGAEERQDRHAGSTLLALDVDGSGVMDLVIGDVSYNNMTLLTNVGEEVNSNSGMGEQDAAFPSETTPVDLSIFPAGYHLDLDNDGERDLLVSPNSKVASENVESVWRYTNIGTDADPLFDFEETNFLQEGMIDVGSAALPVFFDHNGDGLKDLIISSRGEYDPETTNLKSKLHYYENVGTEEAPSFQFITDDYQGISELGVGSSNTFYPTFGDLDGDGDEDLILGEYTGYCYYFQNTGGAGNPAIFNTFIILNDSDGSPIIDGAFVYPKLVDLDRDGDLDLALGRRLGKITYYENTGVGSYSFEFRTDFLGEVLVATDDDPQGHAIPEFLDIDEEYHLIVGSSPGNVHYYDDIDENMDGAFHLVTDNLDNIDVGIYSAPAIYDLDGNTGFEMVLGNLGGGVVLFESEPTVNIGIEEIESSNYAVYPNPTNDHVMIDLRSISAKTLKSTEIRLFDLSGKEVKRIKPTENVSRMSLDHVASGTYILQIQNSNGVTTEKIVIQ